MARNKENPRFFSDGCWKQEHSPANSMMFVDLWSPPISAFPAVAVAAMAVAAAVVVVVVIAAVVAVAAIVVFGLDMT